MGRLVGLYRLVCPLNDRAKSCAFNTVNYDTQMCLVLHSLQSMFTYFIFCSLLHFYEVGQVGRNWLK